MNPETPPNPRAELEARLTAYLLGELPAHEAAALRQALDEDAELARLCDRLKPTINLVQQAAAPAQSATAQPAEVLRLSEDRRQKLLAHFKTITPKEFAAPQTTKPSTWPMTIAACAALLMVSGWLLLPALSKAKTKATRFSVAGNLRQIETAKQIWASDYHKSPEDAPTLKELAPYLGRNESGELPSLAGETYLPGKVGESPIAEIEASNAKKAFGVNASSAGRGELAQMDVDGKLTTYDPAKVAVTMGAAASVPPRTGKEMLLADNGAGERPRGQIATVFGNESSGLTPLSGQRGTGTAEQVDPQTTPPPPVAAPRTTIVLPVAEQLADATTPANKGRYGFSLLGPTADNSDVPPSTGGKLELPALTPAPSDTQLGAQLQWPEASQAALAPPKTETSFNWMIGGGGGIGGTLAPAAANVFNSGLLASDAEKLKSPAGTSLAQDNLALSSFQTPADTGGDTFVITESGRSVVTLNVAPPPAAPPISADNLTAGRAYQSVSSSDVTFAVTNSFGGGNTRAPASVNYRTGGNVATTNSQSAADYTEKLVARRNSSLTFADQLPHTGALFKSSSYDANGNRQAGEPVTLAYADKQRELAKLTALKNEMTESSRIEANIKGGRPPVILVDEASPAKAPPSGFGANLRRTLTGTQERRAQVWITKNDSNDNHPEQRNATAVYDPQFVQTEAEVIQSEPVLDQVIKGLDLKKNWAAKKGSELSQNEARQLLRKRLDLTPEAANSHVLNIGVKSKQPEEAAKIANAVAEAYMNLRNGQIASQELSNRSEQLAELDLKVNRAKEDLDGLQKQKTREETEIASKNVVVQNAQNEPDEAAARPAAPIPAPQPEVLTRENAFSTFSLNVADVSYRLAAASLEKGRMPDPASIRSEEFINAFDYRDPDPAPGAPLGFAWERANYPFAQNRDLLRFSIKTAAAGRAPGRALNIVLLLDNSGSMERADRVQIIHEALRVLATQLQPQDTLSVVTFARTPRLWVDGVPGNQAGDVAEKVSGLTPQGGTNLEDAMRLAYETALRHYLANGINRVVLLTDGAANLGNIDPVALKQKVEEHRKQGIALDCFGIGWEGFNDDLLETLSRNGDGRYAFLNTPEEAARDFAGQLAGAFNVAAADVKVQVEFNPKRVSAYRQIGYAKHQLTAEQFRDNTVDAAEIGAAESGNALYVVQVNPAGEGSLGTVRVRFKVPGTSEYQEHAWEVPYTGNGVALDQASPALRLAATASAFSEWLNTSPYAAEVTPDQLLRYVAGVPQIYGADTRPAKLEWMIRQAKSISGK